MSKYETSKLNSKETALKIEKYIYSGCSDSFFYPYSYEALSHLLSAAFFVHSQLLPNI